MQTCPICQTETKPNPRYPKYVCRDCLKGGVVFDGVRLELSELDVYSMRFIECEVAGVRCRARQAHMGGVVIEPA